MATEEILMAAVQAGGDRQKLHERIRQHAMAAGEQVKLHGKPNDLIERLRGDPMFRDVDFTQVMDPSQFTGRSVAQVTAFVVHIVAEVRNKYGRDHGGTADVSV
jgi:adenylosuccinate lyase